MPQHTSAQNVHDLARITAETAMAIATATDAIQTQTFQVTDQPLLAATFSDLASRIDNLSTLADQFDNLRASLEKALAPPETI